MTETLTRLPALPLSVVRRVYREAASAYRNNCDGDVRDIARYRLKQEQLYRLVRLQAAALTAAHAERDAALRAKRVTFCHFCLVKIDLNGMTPPQALDALKEHSLTCAESPIVAQLAAALRERDALAAQLAQQDEARAILERLVEHGEWYASAVELDTRYVDGEALRGEVERVLAQRGETR